MISPRVIQAKTLANHELAVTFDDGQKRTFSMFPYLEYPAFAPLKDIALFRQARVAHGTVIWTDEIDISPTPSTSPERQTELKPANSRFNMFWRNL